MGAGHGISPTLLQPALPPPSGSVECVRAEPAALRSLPCQIVLWGAARSRAGGSRQLRLGSCPELPALPRCELPGLGAASEPGAGQGGREAPRSAAKYFSWPVGSAGYVPMQCVRGRLESWLYPLILIRD